MRSLVNYGDDKSPIVEHDEIFHHLRERIFRFAASRLSREAAEDVTQETLLLLHEKYAQIVDPAELLPLSFQVLRFKIAALSRKSYRRGEGRNVRVEDLPLPSASEDPERLASRAELRTRLLESIRDLGERCREIFRLKLQGRNFEEIRKHLNVESINTIYTWDSRCRKSLLERMGGHWERPVSREPSR